MNADDEQAEREARRMLIVKRVFEVLGWLTAVALLAFASHAVFAADGGRINRATLHGVALNGYARNLDDGSVEVYAVGSPEKLSELAGQLRQGPRWSQ